LGYHVPKELNDEEIANMPPKKKGMIGTWWEGQMKHAQQVAEERKGQQDGVPATAAVAAKSTATSAAKPTAKPASGTAATARPYPRNSPKGKMLAEQAKREAFEVVEADIPAEASEDADVVVATPGSTPAKQKKAKR